MRPERPVPWRPGRRLLTGARTRILLAFIVLLAASTFVSTVALREILLARVGERVERALVQDVEEFRILVRQGNNPLTGEPFGDDVASLFDVFLQRNIPGEGENFYTFLDGSRYASTRPDLRGDLLRQIVALGDATGTRRGTLVTGDAERRYLSVPVIVEGRNRGVFLVTVRLDQEREEVGEAVQISAGVSLIVLLLASVLAYVIAGRVLAPLRGLSDTARSITETELTRRIDVEGNDEIADLGRTFNDMLARLEAAFGSQKEFISDAGHELRTPITIIRGHLELLGDDPRERRETVELVVDELDRMSRFVDDLLLLARAEQGDFLRVADVDLDVLTDELMAKAQGLAPRDWTLDARGTGRLEADRQRLTQALMQLAANAVQHTDVGDRIALGTTLSNGHARLWVTDTGPGVSAADRQRIFDRFARGAGSARRSEGAGLGLAIVRAIAEAHGGRVELDSRPGFGATFTVIVPTEPPQEVPSA